MLTLSIFRPLQLLLLPIDLRYTTFFLGSVIPPTEGTNIKTDELTALVVSSSREKKSGFGNVFSITRDCILGDDAILYITCIPMLYLHSTGTPHSSWDNPNPYKYHRFSAPSYTDSGITLVTEVTSHDGLEYRD